MDAFAKLEKRDIEVRHNESMAGHTSFKIGGEVSALVLPKTLDELKLVLRTLKADGIPYRILGRGSNILVRDEGLDCAVISTEKLDVVIIEGSKVTAFAGASLTALSKKVAENGLSGLEFAYGIPGSVGGAVVMNAGAYGGEMRDVIESVSVLTPEGEDLQLNAEELQLGYRSSCIEEKGYMVISACLKLEEKSREEIFALMEKNMAARKEKQPLEYPSAGSTFKRPKGQFAGKLIMDAGLRGLSVGGAKVSEKHCGFVINTGGATARDVRELIAQIEERVKKNSGVELECEIRLWDN